MGDGLFPLAEKKLEDFVALAKQEFGLTHSRGGIRRVAQRLEEFSCASSEYTIGFRHEGEKLLGCPPWLLQTCAR